MEFVRLVRNLYQQFGIDPGLVDPLVDWLDADDSPSGALGAESAYYGALSPAYRCRNGPLDSLYELLAVRGYDAALLQRLRPFVTALPQGSLVNVNTAPPEVLAALQPALPRDVVSAIEAARKAAPFRTVRDLTGMEELRRHALPVKWLTTVSRYFHVTSGARWPGAAVSEETVLDRAASPMRVLECS
jgi:general secretion pathway protein K